jgi:outer membrane protein OmpA-like peptidoglycan-associated protein/opacity protein-like surface antigen
MKSQHIGLTFLLILLASSLSAQMLREEPAPSPGYGVFGNFHHNMHTTDFRVLPGVPGCCPQYTDGDGDGFGIGLLYEIPLATRLSLALRGSYATHGALLLSRETTTVGINGVPTVAIIEHSIDAGLSSIGLEPLLGYRLLGDLRFHAGGRVGYVLGKRYEQNEELIQPDGTFENGLRTRNPTSGDIPDASATHAALVTGFSYSLPMNGEGTLFLRPELLYAFGITPVVSDLTWQANAVRAGIAIVYTPRVEVIPLEAPPPPPPPPPPPAKPALACELRLAGLDAEGSETPLSGVLVEEFVSTQFRPMLAYVFFEENSAVIPERYHTLPPAKAASFAPDDLHLAGMLDVHHHLLNIIGRRLREHPFAAIAITGCNANVGTEAGNTALSRSRAETVRDYLRTVWGVEERRMTVQARDLPSRPSGSDQSDGIAENRRVELSSDTWEIMQPILTRGNERQVTPPAIRFTPSITSEAGVRAWALVVSQNDRELKRFEGNGTPPPSFDWETAFEPESIPSASEDLAYVLTVRDASDQTTRTRGVMPLTVRKVDREVGRYSLILFDFDQATLNPYNRRIADMIRPAIGPAAEVRITGYTDRIGEAAYNLKLSEDRARNVARVLGISNARVKGLGQSVELHDNRLPEGRFYSRTVNILVEKER